MEFYEMNFCIEVEDKLIFENYIGYSTRPVCRSYWLQLGVIEQQKTEKLYPCDMAFSLGIVTNLKIWYNTRMKSKEWWALGNSLH